MGVVYAHSIREQVQMFGRRIFAIDLGMASNEWGSFLVIGPQGAISFEEGVESQFESVKDYFAQRFPPT